ILILLILLFFSVIESKAQTFINNTIEPDDWTDSISRIVTVNGLPANLCGGNVELIQVNLNMGDSVNSHSLGKMSVTLTSPEGNTITIVVYNPIGTCTFPGAGDIKLRTKFRDNQYLVWPAEHAAGAYPWHIGYYRTGTVNNFSDFCGENPNGDWLVKFHEYTVTDGAQFNKVELIFKNALPENDQTLDDSPDNCDTPGCIGGDQITIATNNSYTPYGEDLPNTLEGCGWNGAQNNSGWFGFTPTETSCIITISGLSDFVQAICVGNSAGLCTAANYYLLTGGCPYNLINDDYPSAQYSNGSDANMQFKLSNLIIGETYYLVLDGTGGVISPFYIEVDNADFCTICPIPTITQQPSDITICEGDNAIYTVSAFGNPPLSYQWKVNEGSGFINASGGVYTGITTDTLVITGASSSMNGYEYCCQISDLCGPAQSDTVILIVNALPSANAGSDVAICNGNSTTIDASGSTGNPVLTYDWDNGLGAGVSHSVSPLSNTTYTVTATDGNSCTNTDAVVVTVNALPSVNAGIDQTVCTGTAVTLSGSGATSYIWDNGLTNGTPFTALSTITYTVTGTDGNGCSNTDQVIVTVNALPIVSFTGLNSPYCAGDPQFNIVGNQAPSGTYTPAFIDNGDGTATIDPTVAEIYNITYSYTDGNGCLASDVQQLTINEIPSVNSLLITDITVCAAPYDGEITVTATGGAGVYDYSIDGGTYSSNNTFTGLNVGAYTISILDTNSCSLDTIVTVNNNAGFNIDSIIVSEILCFGDTNAQLTIYAQDAVIYSIDNGTTYGSDSIFYNLGAGTYNIMAQDAGSCIDISIINISEPSSLELNTSFTNESCNGSNGTAEVNVTGGIIPYNYLWSNDSTDYIITNLSAGNYSVTVTDNNGCSTDTSLTIINDGGILSTSFTNITDVDCYGNSTGSGTIQVTGSGTYTYLWSNGDTTATTSGIPAGTYFMTVSDLFGCSGFDTLLITQPAILSYSDSIVNVTCHGYNNGQIYLNVTGGTPSYSYSWIGPNSFSSTSANISNLSHGGYYVTITDANDCSVSGIEFSISEPEKPVTIVISANPPECYNNADGIANATVTGGTPPYEYFWSNDDTGTSASNLGSGEYNITVIDGNLCTEIDTFFISAPDQIISNETITNTSCIGNNDGNILLNVSGGTAPYSFVWNTDPVQYDSLVINLFANDYSVTITDFNNCAAVNQYTVSEGTDICLNIPNVFTPNGDGVNDIWEITGINLYEKVDLEIFNRWGDVIYAYSGSGSGYASNPWDGTFNGRELPISSYIYVLDIIDSSESYNGIVTIKK
ncbi:MAG: gliding motility-associated C-terminal domain-containing protein, partial [Bacteroidota bacterium]